MTLALGGTVWTALIGRTLTGQMEGLVVATGFVAPAFFAAFGAAGLVAEGRGALFSPSDGLVVIQAAKLERVTPLEALRRGKRKAVEVLREHRARCSSDAARWTGRRSSALCGASTQLSRPPTDHQARDRDLEGASRPGYHRRYRCLTRARTRAESRGFDRGADVDRATVESMSDTADLSRHSAPASPLPPRPEGERRRLDTNPGGDGWRPAEADSTIPAIDFRSRRGERLGVENRTAIGRLATSMDALATAFNKGNDAWAKRWAALSRLLWIVGPAVLLMVLGGGGALAWHWISTLRH